MARVQDNSGILKEAVKLDTVMSKNDHRKFRDQAWRVYGLQKVEKIRHIAVRHGMTIHQLACKWLLMEPALAAITATLLNEQEIREVCEAVDKPNLTRDELIELARGYSTNWDLGDEAHPCDLKSSTDPSGTVRSTYVPPPVLIA
jgi:aryl-alcohol dehydrogenase-like predicted oxidoreductase